MKATIEQYEKWVEFEEKSFSSFGRVDRGFKYAKGLGVDEFSNCQACGDVATPDCENGDCFLCGYFKGEWKINMASHPDPLVIIYKDGYKAGYDKGVLDTLSKFSKTKKED